MSLGDEKCVATTTYRKSGAGVSTATWVVALEGNRVGFWTSSASGKAKRLANNPRITLQPSDSRGRVKPDTTATEGTATVMATGPDFDDVTARVKKKYGWQVPLTRALWTLTHIGKRDSPYANRVVIVELN